MTPCDERATSFAIFDLMSSPQDLRVTLVQADLNWEDPNANRSLLEGMLADAAASDLIILPEMFPTGFSMRPEFLAENMDGDSRRWMTELARSKNSVVTGSIIIQDGDDYFNRLIWMRPDGTHKTYDKRHLFSFAGEHEHYASGNKRLIVSLKGWNICPLICYDLRFPVWCRNQQLDGGFSNAKFDLQIFVANWPEARREPWMTLLEARAHENQCYVIGVNRIGNDGNNIPHSGDSGVYDMKGRKISSIQPNEPTIETITLSYSELEDFRAKFTAWNDKDRFKIS